LVVPNEIEDRIGVGATLFLVERLQPLIELPHDPGVALCFTRRRAAGPVPLQPAAGIRGGTLVFSKAGARELNNLGLNRGGVDVVVFAVVLPEPRGLRV